MKEMCRFEDFLDVSEFILTCSSRSMDSEMMEPKKLGSSLKTDCRADCSGLSAFTSTRADFDWNQEDITPEEYYLGALGLSPEILQHGGNEMEEELSFPILFPGDISSMDGTVEAGNDPFKEVGSKYKAPQSGVTPLVHTHKTPTFNSEKTPDAGGLNDLEECPTRNSNGRFRKKPVRKGKYGRRCRPIKNQDRERLQNVVKQNRKSTAPLNSAPARQPPKNIQARLPHPQARPQSAPVKRKVGRPRKTDKLRT